MFKLLRKIADENSEHAGTLKISLIDPGTIIFEINLSFLFPLSSLELREKTQLLRSDM